SPDLAANPAGQTACWRRGRQTLLANWTQPLGHALPSIPSPSVRPSASRVAEASFPAPDLRLRLLHECHRHIHELKELGRHGSKQHSAHAAQAPRAHDDVVNVLLSSHAVDGGGDATTLHADAVVDTSQL